MHGLTCAPHPRRTQQKRAPLGGGVRGRRVSECATCGGGGQSGGGEGGRQPARRYDAHCSPALPDAGSRGSGSAHEHRRIEALESLDSARVGVVHQPLGHLVGPRRQQHPQHHVIRRTRRLLGQQLLDDAGQTMVQLVDESQVRTVVHLVRAGAVGGARLLRELVQEQIQQSRLVDEPQLLIELDFGIEIHGACWRYAGKKSMGLVVVTVSTSLASKRNRRTSAMILRSRSWSLSSLETMRHMVTSPVGAMVNSSTSLPCSSALSRSARAYRL